MNTQQMLNPMDCGFLAQTFLLGLEYILVLAKSRKILKPVIPGGILVVQRWKWRKCGAMFLFKATVEVSHPSLLSSQMYRKFPLEDTMQNGKAASLHLALPHYISS